MAALDFDGSGHPGIYALQNSYAPIPAVGRFDGGLSQLLRGDGHGGFVPVPVAESGLEVPGDAKALAVLDLEGDGWPDLLVSRNGSPAMAFRHGRRAGRNSFRVRLRGHPGNPTAVGSFVTVEHANGMLQAAEVTAGSGYYSQSSADCFFGWETGNAPRQIRVRWSSGRETAHDFRAGAATLVFAAPGA